VRSVGAPAHGVLGNRHHGLNRPWRVVQIEIMVKAR
jgi:hypothetical protein